MGWSEIEFGIVFVCLAVCFTRMNRKRAEEMFGLYAMEQKGETKRQLTEWKTNGIDCSTKVVCLYMYVVTFRINLNTNQFVPGM